MSFLYNYFFDIDGLRVYRVQTIEQPSEGEFNIQINDGWWVFVDQNKMMWNNAKHESTPYGSGCHKFYFDVMTMYLNVKKYRDNYKYPTDQFIQDHEKCIKRYQELCELVDKIKEEFAEELV